MRSAVVFIPLLAGACYGKRVTTSRKKLSDAPVGAKALFESKKTQSPAKLLAAYSPAGAFQQQRIGSPARTSSPRNSGGSSAKMEVIGDDGSFSSLAFLRHSEIKHGRLAMAAFVGYLVQTAVNWCGGFGAFPFQLTSDVSCRDIALSGSPPEQWDALPTSVKLRFIMYVGLLEALSETGFFLTNGFTHWTKGAEPGRFTKRLGDPFGITKLFGVEDEMNKDVDNGRAAMLGIMCFLSEQKVPGAVPGLKVIAPNLKPYSGEFMGPFTSNDFEFMKTSSFEFMKAAVGIA